MDVPGVTPGATLHVQTVTCIGTEAPCRRLFVFAGSKSVWNEDLARYAAFDVFLSGEPGKFSAHFAQEGGSASGSTAIYTWDATNLSRSVLVQLPGDASGEQPSSTVQSTADTAVPPATDNAPQSTQDNTQSSVELGGLNTGALNAKALQLLSTNPPELNGARLALEKAAQLAPADIEILNNLGFVYGKSGMYRPAEAVLLRVLSLAPNRRVALGNLGLVDAKLGKTEAAANYFCQYVRQFASLQNGKSTLVRVMKDPDPNVQDAVKATVANCMS
jgi:hypothetical protein